MPTKRKLSVWYIIVLLAALVLLIIEPLVQDPYTHPFLFNILIETFLYAYLSVAWNILAGLTGQNSFGHAAFFGIGAYSVALLWTRFGISPWIGMIVGVAIAAFASLAVGLPSLKLKRNYFVMITLGFSEILRITMIQWYQFANGAGGIAYPVLDYSWYAFQFNTDRTPYYYIMLGILLLSLFFVYKLKSSKWGYYFMAIREDEIATSTSGIDVVKYKLMSAVLSAVLTAIGGVFFAQFLLYIDPDTVMSLNVMTYIFMPAAIGGIGTIMGPVLGSFILIPLGEFVRTYVSTAYGIQGLHLIIFGVLILIVGTIMPKGILGTFFKRVGRTEQLATGSYATATDSSSTIPMKYDPKT